MHRDDMGNRIILNYIDQLKESILNGKYVAAGFEIQYIQKAIKSRLLKEVQSL